MEVRDDCRHYSCRSLPGGDLAQRCRLDMAQAVPFGCPPDCLFFEARPISDTGWDRGRSGR